MKAIHVTLVFLAFLANSTIAEDKEFIIFPKKNQSSEQMEQDKAFCYNWSKEQTGFDPKTPPTTETAPPPKQAKQGGILRGAVRGAILGEIVDDDASTGAKAGAASGLFIRSDQKRQEAHTQKQWETKEAAVYTEKRNTYNRAYKTCMEAKDYALN